MNEKHYKQYSNELLKIVELYDEINKTNLIASGSGWDDGLNLYSSDATNRWNLLVDNGAGDMFRIAYNNSEKLRVQTDGEVFTIGTGKAGSDFRAPIFYDSNNTSFYLNPDGTSNLSTLSTDTNEGIFNNQRRNHSTYTNFNDTGLRAGINYLQQGTNGPTGTASHQWYGWRLGLGGDYGTQTGSSGHYAQEWYIARKGQGGNI